MAKQNQDRLVLIREDRDENGVTSEVTWEDAEKKVFSHTFSNTDLIKDALLRGEVIRTSFANWRLKPAAGL